jgi:hypothetical protein
MLIRYCQQDVTLEKRDSYYLDANGIVYSSKNTPAWVNRLATMHKFPKAM